MALKLVYSNCDAPSAAQHARGTITAQVYEPQVLRTLSAFSTSLARAEVAAALSHAISLSGLSNAQVGKALGISEGLVRMLRKGSRRIRVDHVENLPSRVRETFLRVVNAPANDVDAPLEAA